MEPGLVGRQDEMGALRSALTSGSGAVVAGPAGIGKTRLVSEAVQATGRQVWWVAATREAGTLPHGPFLPLLAELEEAQTPAEGHGPAYGTIRRAIKATESPPILVVDDAQHLDDASAATVHALALGGSCPVVVTVRSGDPLPEAVTALWKDAGLLRMELGPLTQEEADTLCEVLLDGPVDVRTRTRFWRLSGGNPLELRELTVAARESGALSQVGGIWSVAETFAPTSRLVELVEGRLRRLDDAERSAAELVAYAEPLDIRILVEVVDRSVIDRLERTNLVRVHSGGSKIATVSSAHPLYGEVLRATLPTVRTSEIAEALATAATGAVDAAVDPLRVALWRLEAGTATVDELQTAAREAVGRMAWDVALRLGSAALEVSESYGAHGAVGASLAELGDVDSAERHLRRAQELTDDPLLVAWADISLADLWFYHAGRMEEALELVRKRIAVTTDLSIRDDLISALAVNLMVRGNLEEVQGLVSEVLERQEPSSQARLMALVASTLVAGLMLRPGEVHAGTEVAFSLVEENLVRFPNAEDILHANLVIADIGAGEVDAVRVRTEERRNRAVESDRADLPGFWSMLHGQVLLYEGRAQASHDALVEAMLLLERFDSWLSRPLALVEAAHAAAVMGLTSDARRYLDAVAPEMVDTPRIRSRWTHVQAQIDALDEGVSKGAARAVFAGDQAAGDHHLLWAAEAWHLAVRLGYPDLVSDRLRDLADDRPGTVATLYSDHAQALAARDLEALGEVFRGMAGRRFGLFAAEVACQMAGIHRRNGDRTGARRYAATALEVLPEGSGVRTPPFSDLPDTQPLTPREREVALLAARGLTSRDIADRLYLSVRSVDNHLSRVYTKLGVAGRSELHDVVGPAPEPA